MDDWNVVRLTKVIKRLQEIEDRAEGTCYIGMDLTVATIMNKEAWVDDWVRG